MPMEVKYLLGSAALAVLQMTVATIGLILQVGLPAAAGNRENLPAATSWVGRAQRAHRNMLENLVLFAIVVLVAQAQGKFNATTLLGAELFFWARVAYAIVYPIGIPWLRTAIFVVSFVGILQIFLQLI